MSLPSNILVATWDMQDGDSAAKQEMTLGSSEESVQGQDTRILVTPNEFKTGGKYRGTYSNVYFPFQANTLQLS